MAGHTDSYGFHIRAMRQIVNSGKIGKPTNMHAIAFTDWIMRPRSAEEMDPTQGGGLVWRQVPHQVDSIRLIGGGQVLILLRGQRVFVVVIPFEPLRKRKVHSCPQVGKRGA